MKKGARREFLVGVDLGGTKILACVATAEGRIIGSAKRKTQSEQGSSKVLDRIEETVSEALQEAGLSLRQVRGIGVAVPGAVEASTGIVRIAPNLGWKDFPVRKELALRFKRPVVVENDANAGLYGEAAYGAFAGKGDGLLVGVFVGTGVGGALMMGGRLIRGAAGLAGEIGHVTVDPKGPRCGCGNHGCLEAFASRTAVVKRIVGKIRGGKRSLLPKIADRGLSKVGSSALAAAYRERDPITVREVRRSAKWLGIAVAGMVNLMNPDGVVIGGGYLEALGRPVFQKIVREAQKTALKASYRCAKIRLSKLGDHAIPLGAAALALDAGRRKK